MAGLGLDVAATSMRGPREGERFASALAETVESRVADVLTKALFSIAVRIEGQVREEDRRLHFGVSLPDDVEEVQRLRFRPELSAHLIDDEKIEVREALDCLGFGLLAPRLPGLTNLGDEGSGLDEERGPSGLMGATGDSAGEMRFSRPATAEEDERISVVQAGDDVSAKVDHDTLHSGLFGRLGDVARNGRLSVSAGNGDTTVSLLRDSLFTARRAGIEENEGVIPRASSEWVAAVLFAGKPLGDTMVVLDPEAFAFLGRSVVRGWGGFANVRVRRCSRFRTAGAGRQISAETAEFFHNFFLQKRLRRGTPNRARCT